MFTTNLSEGRRVPGVHYSAAAGLNLVACLPGLSALRPAVAGRTHERAFKLKRVTALALVMFTLAASAQPRPQPEPLTHGTCNDDRGVDRCTESQQRWMEDLYGVRSIEAHGEAGDQVRRVFYVDGFGRDVVLIAFLQPAEDGPIVSVHFPREGNTTPPDPLQAPMPEILWNDMLWRSKLIDRKLVPLPIPPETIQVCLHPSMYVVEIADPADGTLNSPKIARTTSNGCDGRMAAWFALETQRAALRLFPPCAALDPEQHRSAASQFAACRLLRGERMAAAAVMNRLGSLGRFPGPGDYRDAGRLFARGAVIDWIGQRSTNQAAGEFWIERMRDAHHPIFYADSVEGLSMTQVRVVGRLQRSVEAAAEANSDAYRAQVEMLWAFDSANGFLVEQITVAAWEAEE